MRWLVDKKQTPQCMSTKNKFIHAWMHVWTYILLHYMYSYMMKPELTAFVYPPIICPGRIGAVIFFRPLVDANISLLQFDFGFSAFGKHFFGSYWNRGMLELFPFSRDWLKSPPHFQLGLNAALKVVECSASLPTSTASTSSLVWIHAQDWCHISHKIKQISFMSAESKFLCLTSQLLRCV